MKDFPVSVADAIWVATAMLHGSEGIHESFPRGRICDRVIAEIDSSKNAASIKHNISVHCLANLPVRSKSDNHCKLYREGRGKYRLYRRGEDDRDPSRRGCLVEPDMKNLPPKHRRWIGWYHKDYCGKRAPPAATRTRAGAGAGVVRQGGTGYFVPGSTAAPGTLPSRKDMMKPLLRGITDGKEHPTSDLKGILAERFGLTEAGLQTRRVNYELGWAKTYLTKISLARYPRRAHLQITKYGRRLVNGKGCPGRITRQCVEALGMEPGLADVQYLAAL